MRQILLYTLSNLFDSINLIKLIWPCKRLKNTFVTELLQWLLLNSERSILRSETIPDNSKSFKIDEKYFFFYVK